MLDQDGFHPAPPDFDSVAPCAALEEFRFGHNQHDHIETLIGLCGSPIVWNPLQLEATDRKLIVVTRPLNGAQIESFKRSASPQSIVLIPFGENPAFDNLKLRLATYGTITSSPHDGPHQLWWGGVSREPVLPPTAAQFPLVVCGHPNEGASAPEPEDIAKLSSSLDRLGIAYSVETVDHVMPGHLAGIHKIDLILKQWQRSDRPILWVDRNAVFCRPPELLTAFKCDFAFYKARGWQFATKTLYFAKTAGAERILRTWKKLAESYPAIWEGYLLDQAWALVSSQSALSTLWLPRTYQAPPASSRVQESGIIAYSPADATNEPDAMAHFPANLVQARRSDRTGCPEAQIVLNSQKGQGQHGTLMVLVEAAPATDPHAVASTLERIVAAFRHDPGGFSQLEVSLCRDQDDLAAFTAAAGQMDNRILSLDPTGSLPADTFRSFGERFADGPRNRIIRLPAQTSGRTTVIQYWPPVGNLKSRSAPRRHRHHEFASPR
jgi:hypothetical protein